MSLYTKKGAGEPLDTIRHRAHLGVKRKFNQADPNKGKGVPAQKKRKVDKADLAIQMQVSASTRRTNYLVLAWQDQINKMVAGAEKTLSDLLAAHQPFFERIASSEFRKAFVVPAAKKQSLGNKLRAFPSSVRGF